MSTANCLRAPAALRAFNQWISYAACYGEFRRTLAHALYIFTPEGRSLQASFNSWYVHWETRRLLLLGARSFLHTMTRRSFNAWHWRTSTNALQLAEMHRAVSAMRLRECHEAFNSWIDFAALRGEARRSPVSYTHLTLPTKA